MGQVFAPQAPLPPPPPAPRPPSLPDITAADWRRLAMQTRPLRSVERSMVSQPYRGAGEYARPALDPNILRLGYDFGAQGTNLNGWNSAVFPSVVFVRPDSEDPIGVMKHESGHVYQNLSKRKYVNDADEDLHGYDYEMPNPPKRFEDFGPEQQAEMIRDSHPLAMEFLKTHQVSGLDALAASAFLDSVREAENRKAKRPPPRDDSEEDFRARLGSVGGISAVGQKKNTLFEKNPWEKK